MSGPALHRALGVWLFGAVATSVRAESLPRRHKQNQAVDARSRVPRDIGTGFKSSIQGMMSVLSVRNDLVSPARERHNARRNCGHGPSWPGRPKVRACASRPA